MAKLYLTDSSVNLKDCSNELLQYGSFPSLCSVKVKTGKEKQSMLGFGIAVTEASAFLMKTLTPEKQQMLLESVFGNSGLRLSIARICVGASDYSTKCYNYNDTVDDCEMRNFSISHDMESVIPVVKQIKEICPNLFLFSSLWSAPGWMKTGGSMYGGWLREKYVEAFSNYYKSFLDQYEQQGLHIDAFTTQNEVETDQCGKSVACYLHPELEERIICDYLIPYLREKGSQTQAWLLDHNFIHWNRVKWQLDNEKTKQFAGGVAFHFYEGVAGMASELHNAHPEVPIHWTEGGPNLGEEYLTDWCYWGRVFSEALANWCSSITGWNLLLDQNGNPNIGPFRCAGLATVHSESKEISFSGQYHALGHFSRFVSRGAKYLECSSSGGQYDHSDRKTALYQSAFKNPDGSVVVVVTNPFNYQDVCIHVGKQNVRVAMPENSIATVVFDNEEI